MLTEIRASGISEDMPSRLQFLALGLYIGTFVIAMAGEAMARSRSQPLSDRRLATNFALGIAGSILASLPWLSSYTAAEFAAAHGLGLFNQFEMPVALAWLFGVCAFSFMSYWMHRGYHRFDWLWPIHRVHHSDAAIDVSSSLRAHPLEYVLDALAGCGLVLLMGLSPPVLVAILISVQMPSLLSHANVALPGRMSGLIERLIVTPRAHLRHHSSLRAEHDSNYGTSLTLWDRLFGTWCAELPTGPLGLSPSTPR